MLWMEPAAVVYTGFLGAIIGSIVTILCFKRFHRNTMFALETYWNSDVRTLKTLNELLSQRISKIEKLLTNSGENFVNKDE